MYTSVLGECCGAAPAILGVVPTMDGAAPVGTLRLNLRLLVLAANVVASRDTADAWEASGSCTSSSTGGWTLTEKSAVQKSNKHIDINEWLSIWDMSDCSWCGVKNNSSADFEIFVFYVPKGVFSITSM